MDSPEKEAHPQSPMPHKGSFQAENQVLQPLYVPVEQEGYSPYQTSKAPQFRHNHKLEGMAVRQH